MRIRHYCGMKARNESRIPRFTAPDKDLEGFNCRTTIFQNKLRNHSAADPSLPMTPCGKTSATDSEKLKNVHVPCKSVKTFVPPCTTKARTPGESGNAATFDTFKDDTRIEHDQMEEPNARRAESDVPVTESGTAQYSTLLGDGEHNNQGLREMIENLHCARDMQMMRIRKKQRQIIRPQPGSLYMTKTSTQDRIPFKTAVEGKCPFAFSIEQLHMFGVLKHSIMVNGENAELFQFDCLDHFTKDDLHAGQGIQIADGGWLIPSDNHKAGKEELYRALCDTPGVDPKLISGPWAYNHYRWIVWKLAAMEVSFPEKFASSCLTPERVLLQLKYRYDVEVDKSQRSAVKKIMERDDTAAKTLVLCISKIISMGTNLLSPNNSKCSVADGKNSASIIEVTDGWYGIKAILDTPLSALVSRKRILVGSKIIVHGAELIGSEDACTPLEAPESLMLKISANSTRLARWYARLGFHTDPRPFPLLLSSLFSDGGIVGCIDVIIQRTYPLQWMEKMANGMYIFRNERAEEREAEKHAAKQQKNLEALFVKIQAEFEQNEVKAKRQKVKRRTLTRKQIYAMQDGAELYEAIQNESDPGYLETCLSDEQLRALNSHRQILNDKKQAEVQAEFRRAIESDEHGQNACGKRDVTAIWKLRIVDYKNQGQDAAFILNIWRPLSDVRSLLKEGGRYKMFHLSTSHSKSKSDTCDVQLTATKKTQYQQLQPSQEILSSIYRPRHAVQFTELLEPSFHTLCSEVDLVGYIVSVSRKSGLPPQVYLSDENYNFIAIKFWTDLGQLGIEDVMTPSTLIACSNIQWRKNSNLSIPTMFAGELSIVSTNPKDRHLREAICKLKSTVQSIKCFSNDAERKLVNLLERSHLDALISPPEYALGPRAPTWKSGCVAVNKCLTPTTHEKTQLKDSFPMTTPGLKCSETPTAANISPEGSSTEKKEMDSRKRSKMRKALDFLSRMSCPPPCSPGQAMVSPSLQKAFRPPRSCGPKQSNIKARDEKHNSMDFKAKPLCNNTTSSTLEDGWVADDELAMINTQGLLSNGAEEKKTCSLSKSAIEPSCDVELKQESLRSSTAIKGDVVVDLGQEAEDPENKLNATQIPVVHQRKLQRKKRK